MKRRLAILLPLFLATGGVASAEVTHQSGSPDAVAQKEARALNDVAASFLNKGKLDQAIEVFTKAIARDPNSSFAFYNRGTAYALRKELNRAIEDYSYAVRIDPEFALAFMNRGVAYSMESKFVDALNDLNKAVELEPGRVDSYYNRALVFTKLGQLAEAAKEPSSSIVVTLSYTSPELRSGKN